MLPSNVSFGTVVGRFMRAVADGPDAGRDPDGIPFAGLTVKFIPTADRFKNITAVPPVTIVADPITATTDAEGYLIDPQGERGIRLLATDDEDLSPTGWTWGVAISGTGFRTLTFNFALPTDGEIDLATVVPVPGNPGQAMQDWLAAVAASEAAATSAGESAVVAVAAAVDAVAAKDAAEAVPAQVDTAMAEQVGSGGEFDTKLNATIDQGVGARVPGQVAAAIADDNTVALAAADAIAGLVPGAVAVEIEPLEDTVYGEEVPVPVPDQNITHGHAHYKTMKHFSNQPIFQAGVEYELELIPTASFTTELRTGTAPNGSSLVDTIAEAAVFTAGVPYRVQYTPSADNLLYLRILNHANDVPVVNVYTFERNGGLVAAVENEPPRAEEDKHHIAHKINGGIAELRALKNDVDNSLAALTQVQVSEGVTQTITTTSPSRMLRVGLHYGPSRYTPSASEFFFDGDSRKDFTDVRFFDADGNMLKAQLGELVNAELYEDTNLASMVLVTSTGTLVGSNAGVVLSSDNAASWSLIAGTKNVTTNASQTYASTSMIPVLVDPEDNIFAYAGGILYKLLAADGYATKSPVCTFSWTPPGGSTIYPDIKEHAAAIDDDGVMYFGIYQVEFNATIYRSTDGGDTWTVCFNSEGAGQTMQHVHHISPDPFTGDVYAGVDDSGNTFNGAHILKSSDNGVTWADITDDNHAIRGRDFYPTYFGEGYRLGGGESYYNGGGTVYRSEDDVHFDIPVKGVGGVRAYTDFGDDSVIVAGVQHVKGSTENQMLVSYDQGKSWRTFYRKYQPVLNTSGRGFRLASKLQTLQGDTAPCVVLTQGIGTAGVPPVRLYPGGWFREAFILLDGVPTGPVTITAKTGYMMGYPYKNLSEGEHDGLVYHVPLNEGVGRVVSDSEGTIARITGDGYDWDVTEEPVRYGDYSGDNAPKPFMPSSGLKLAQGTTLNFGNIAALDFNHSFTVTFWINPNGLLMDEVEWNDRVKALGILSAGNIALFSRFITFGYTKKDATNATLNASGYRRMETGIRGYGYSDQYFFVTIVVNADGTVKTYINGTNYGNAHETLGVITVDNLSTGDFVIGSNLMQSAGFLSDVKVYNRIIGDAEILEIYRGV